MVIKANICTHLHFTGTRPVRRSTHVAHTRHVNPRCPRLRSLSEHCQNRWSERAAYFCHWLRETVQQKKMIGLWIRKAGGGENVARAKSVKVKNLEFSSLGNKMKRLLNHFTFLPHAFSLFFFHGHAHTDTHTYRQGKSCPCGTLYIQSLPDSAWEYVSVIKKNNQRGTRNVLGWWMSGWILCYLSMSLLLSYWVVKRVEAAERTPLQCVFRQAPPNTPGREPACDSVCWWLIICLHWRYSPSIYFICY